uniref:Uncharacterized protein n=1 Tax=Pan paniscus TaxID=9597 RepID=A0A2R9C315_PANPA
MTHLFMTQDLEEIGECMIKSHLWHIQYEEVSQCPDVCVCVDGDFITPPIKPNSTNNTDPYGALSIPGINRHLHTFPPPALTLNSRGNLDRTG